VKTYALELASATRWTRIDGVSSFVVEDASGSFGILAGHAPLVACLSFGLARFRIGGGDWEYLALPGGVLHFRDGTLRIVTRHYLRDRDYQRISAGLRDQLAAEEQDLHALRLSAQRLEEAMISRLWALQRRGGMAP
jgi:F-type H+-transporting ATPase subunit epsilon